MSAHPTYILTCDGCQAQWRHPEPVRRATDIREMAAADGWRHRILQVSQGPNPSQDLCPNCNDAPPTKVRAPMVLLPELADYVRAVLRSHVAKEDLVHMDLARRVVEALDRG